MCKFSVDLSQLTSGYYLFHEKPLKEYADDYSHIAAKIIVSGASVEYIVKQHNKIIMKGDDLKLLKDYLETHSLNLTIVPSYF